MRTLSKRIVQRKDGERSFGEYGVEPGSRDVTPGSCDDSVRRETNFQLLEHGVDRARA